MKSAIACIESLRVASKIILANFNLAVTTLTAKPPNLIPHQIFQLYGNYDFCAPWQITSAIDLCVHAEFAVVAKEQLSKESSEPVQVTPCRYTGFRSSIKPPLAAMAPGIKSKHSCS